MGIGQKVEAKLIGREDANARTIALIDRQNISPTSATMVSNYVRYLKNSQFHGSKFRNFVSNETKRRIIETKSKVSEMKNFALKKNT